MAELDGPLPEDEIRSIYSRYCRAYANDILSSLEAQPNLCLSEPLRYPLEGPDYARIAKHLTLDAKVLNFGNFLAGRALGSSIILRNSESVKRQYKISLNRRREFQAQSVRRHCADIPE